MNADEFALARYNIALKNANFYERAVENASDSDWLETNAAGVSVNFIEAAKQDHPRLTMLIRFAPGSHYDLSQHHGGEEFLVLEGSLRDRQGHYHQGYYVRNPTGTAHHPVSDDGCLLFLKLGEFCETDQEHRIIDTNEEEAWLPGPVAGTRVLPLHMHDTRSVLMIRWDADTEFKPGLDPQGEEVFVIEGSLQDEKGHYSKRDWVRNPVSSWHTWRGSEGTMAYYKNGHFPEQTVK